MAVVPKPEEEGGGLGLVELNVKEGVVIEGVEPKADVEGKPKVVGGGKEVAGGDGALPNEAEAGGGGVLNVKLAFEGAADEEAADVNAAPNGEVVCGGVVWLAGCACHVTSVSADGCAAGKGAAAVVVAAPNCAGIGAVVVVGAPPNPNAVVPPPPNTPCVVPPAAPVVTPPNGDAVGPFAPPPNPPNPEGPQEGGGGCPP